MTDKKKYATAASLRAALEERLKRNSREQGVDLQRLRRQVAFDRFLARVFARGAENWALKGGYAMELRLQEARTTKDIDLTVVHARLLQPLEGEIASRIRREIQSYCTEDLQDYFVFLIGEPMMDIDAAPYGGARYPIDVRLDGRTFVKFHLDVGVGDAVQDPLETIPGHDWLGFAQIPPPAILMISKEQQFAEKLHAYTLPNRPTPNSRVKDLVDMVLLIDRSGMDNSRLLQCMRGTFSRRKTHDIPIRLSLPDANWEKPFAALATECGLSMDLSLAFNRLNGFFEEFSRLPQ